LPLNGHAQKQQRRQDWWISISAAFCERRSRRYKSYRAAVSGMALLTLASATRCGMMLAGLAADTLAGYTVER
jgi:hypothetical protein